MASGSISLPLPSESPPGPVTPRGCWKIPASAGRRRPARVAPTTRRLMHLRVGYREPLATKATRLTPAIISAAMICAHGTQLIPVWATR